RRRTCTVESVRSHGGNHGAARRDSRTATRAAPADRPRRPTTRRPPGALPRFGAKAEGDRQEAEAREDCGGDVGHRGAAVLSAALDTGWRPLAVPVLHPAFILRGQERLM